MRAYYIYDKNFIKTIKSNLFGRNFYLNHILVATIKVIIKVIEVKILNIFVYKNNDKKNLRRLIKFWN